MSLAYGVYKAAGSPDAIVPILVDSAGVVQVAGGTGGGSGGTVTVSNFPATQAVSAASLPLPSGASQDGTDASGVTAPAGASGIRGWLSGIYQQMLVLVGIQGPTSSIIDATSTNGYTYICKAPPGTPASASSWQICRIDNSGSKAWAGGSAAFDKIASNRTSYTYS